MKEAWTWRKFVNQNDNFKGSKTYTELRGLVSAKVIKNIATFKNQ